VSVGSPVTLNIYANALSLTANFYQGTITVTPTNPAGPAITITVQFSVGGVTGSSGLTVPAGASRSWSYPGGTTSEVLILNSAGGATSYNATATSTNNWLFVNGSTATNFFPLASGISLTTSAAVTSLTTGYYVGFVQITDSLGETATITVNLTVNAGSVTGLSVTPTLVFSSPSGSTPAAQSIIASSTTGGAFTAVTPTPWLSVVASASTLAASAQGTVQVTANPSGLAAGTYPGTVIVTVGVQSQAVAVTFTVGTTTSGGGGGVGLTVTPFSTIPWTYTTNGTLPITDNLGLVSASNASTYNATATTNKGGNWLLIGDSGANTSLSGVALNQGITFRPNATVFPTLPADTYTGTISITTSNNESATVTVTLTVNGGASTITFTPTTGLTFTGSAGSGALAPQKLSIASSSSTAISFTAAAQVTSPAGGNWLSIDVTSGSTPKDINVTANATGLAAGTYSGTVAITPAGGTAVNVPITLTLTPSSITATPTSLTFTATAGGTAPDPKTVTVSGTSGTGFSATATSTGNWLKVSPATGTTPGSVSVSVDGTGLTAGNYTGTVTISATGGATGSSSISVALTVTAPNPTISKITNGASFATGNISPGEVVTLFGTDLGPGTPATLTLDSSGKVNTTLGGVQVLFNGIAAPLIYVSSTQVSAVVPYEVAQFANVNVTVKFGGQTSAAVAATVTTTAPGVFTLNSSGTGPGAILNQNLSVNAPNNAAARGETVVIYLTGEGQTAPLGVTGKVTTVSATPPLTPAPLLPVAVLIGGQPASISFVGQAPGLVSGVLQINAVVPQTAGTGAVSLTVSVGNNTSQNGVTISLK